jgi:nucleotide-binding universal stress UspA family protein
MTGSESSVLVAYDGSDVARRALEHAADLVGAGGAVSVINVVEAQSVSSRLVTVSDAQRTNQDELLGEAERLLARRNVRANLIRAAGDRSTEILSAARALDADVIVVGRNKQTAPHLVHRSLSSTLARRASADVLVVH